MFGSSSPLSSAFWTSPTKPVWGLLLQHTMYTTENLLLRFLSNQNIDMTRRAKKERSAIDLKRLSVFHVDVASSMPSAGNSEEFADTDQKENKVENRTTSPSKALGKDEIIVELMKEIRNKDSLIAAMEARLDKSPEVVRSRKHRLSQLKSHIIHDNGRMNARMARSGSLLTSQMLEAIPDPTKTPAQLIAENFIKIFQNPVDHLVYLQSKDFATHLIEVCQSVSDVFEDEVKCLSMQSPVYVIGDIHGNLEDLHFFADNMWKLGMDLTAGKFLFLGDYVDR